jgi:formylglycine-generating enzyme required for sulfatase activity
MVRIPFGFCVDSTEVTNAEYQAFVDAIDAGAAPVLAPRCEWITTWSLPQHPICQLGPDYPVACSNWCQAYAFCAWAGKHLCGGLDGGALPYDAGLDPNASEWATMCGGKGAWRYAYGPDYAPVCNTTGPFDAGTYPDGLAPVGSFKGCEGPPGVFDLMGNASEWQDSCDVRDSGAVDRCHHLGGGTRDWKECLDDDNDMRSVSYASTYGFGFRCCAE